MRALLPGLLALACLAQPAAAAPSPDKSDWEQFLRPATPSVEVFSKWVGRSIQPDVDGPDGQHYLVRDRAPFAGGVDCMTTASGEVQEVAFYLAAGPLYLESQLKRAAHLKTPWTLSDVARWYGAPSERHLNARTGATTLVYLIDGDRTRTLAFTSLPHSTYLHRILAERGSD